METNEAFPDRETNPTDLDKLEPQENEAWALYQKKQSR